MSEYRKARYSNGDPVRESPSNGRASYSRENHQGVAAIPQRRTEHEFREHHEGYYYDSEDSDSVGDFHSDQIGKRNATLTVSELKAKKAKEVKAQNLLSEALRIHNLKIANSQRADVFDGRLNHSTTSNVRQPQSIVKEELVSTNRQELQERTIGKTSLSHGSPKKAAREEEPHTSTMSEYRKASYSNGDPVCESPSNGRASYSRENHQGVAALPQRRTEHEFRDPEIVEHHEGYHYDSEDSDSVGDFHSDQIGKRNATLKAKEVKAQNVLFEAIQIHNLNIAASRQADVFDGRLNHSTASNARQPQSIVKEELVSTNRQELQERTIGKTSRSHGSPKKAAREEEPHTRGKAAKQETTRVDETTGLSEDEPTDEVFGRDLTDASCAINFDEEATQGQTEKPKVRPEVTQSRSASSRRSIRPAAHDASAKIIAQQDEGSDVPMRKHHSPAQARKASRAKKLPTANTKPSDSASIQNSSSEVSATVVARKDGGFVASTKESRALARKSNVKKRPARAAANDASAKIIALHCEGSIESTEEWDDPTPAQSSKSKRTSLSLKRLRTEDPQVPVQSYLESSQAQTKLSQTDTVIEVHKNDVVFYENNKYTSSETYTAMVMQHANIDGRKLNMSGIVEVIVESTHKQTPPGRFVLVEDGRPRLLQKKEIFQIIQAGIVQRKKKLKANAVKTKGRGVKRKKNTGSGDGLAMTDGKEAETQPLKNAEPNERMTSAITEAEMPLLAVRDTDVFPSKLPGRGNDFLTKSLSKYTAADCQYAFVDKLIAAIHAQEPPGRFLTPDKQSILTGAAEQLRVLKTLRGRMGIRKPESLNVDLERESEGEPTPQEPPDPSVGGIFTAPLDSVAPPSSFIPHDNDVLIGPEAEEARNEGNILFRKLIARQVDTLDLNISVHIIIQEIKAQVPQGCFWSKGSCSFILTGTAETVAVYDRLICARKKASIEVRETDVLGGSRASDTLSAGNLLLCKLLSNRDYSKDQESVAEDIIAAVHSQNPPGRFWSKDDTFILDERMEKLHVTTIVHSSRDLSALDPSLPSYPDHAAKQKKLAIDRETSESEILQHRCDLPDASPDTYIEDMAWRMFAAQEVSMEDLKPLPPPNPLPPLPTDSPEATCEWNFDASSRILRGKLKPGVKQFSSSDKLFLQLMMERDDIAVITGGHCDILETRSWSLGCIRSAAGEKFHHRFRHFKRTPLTDEENGAKVEYEEADNDVCMRVRDYVDYLQKRSEAITHERETRQQNAPSDVAEPVNGATKFTYRNSNNELVTLDLLRDNIYMLDYDIKKQLPSQYGNFKDNFYLPEFLPGGAKCLMNSVNEAARPDMGPNLYITPPGTFTRFHQDGFGTVDSGHLCMSGYNEVVMFRRLPPGHDRNAINTEGSSLYEMPHADKLGKKVLDWPTKMLMKKLNNMNYCAIVLILGPGELLHIGKGRFHAFRKLSAESLGVDDCHFDLRNEIHAKLRGNGEVVEQLLNVSLAWDWSYAGVTPEGINREMASTLEFALRNRNRSQPKQSLAIPKMSLIATCNEAISYLESADTTLFDITIGKVDEAKKKENYDTLKGLYPTLDFVIRMEQEVYDLAVTAGRDIFHRDFWPNSWENSLAFPLDPFGNSDYFCKICHQELPNAYMHCNGCEDLLLKDLNVCTECHSGLMHERFIGMSTRSQSQNSALNHTGHFKAKKHKACKCEDTTNCVFCKGCCECSCTCHKNFSLHQRMWDNEKLSYVLAKAKNIVGDDKVEHFDEVEHRLRQALESRPLREHSKNMPAVRTPSQERRREGNSLAPPSLNVQHFEVKPYHCIETGTAPTSHLDVSRAAMTFTAPLSGSVSPFTGGAKFEAMTISKLEDFLSIVAESITATDGDSISELAGTALTKNDAVQLYRNFIDCNKVQYLTAKNFIHFTPREHDIIAFAVLQAREERCIPGLEPTASFTSFWGGFACDLIPYRPRKNLLDKFYIRNTSNSNLADKLKSLLANKEYREHLEKRIAPLFDFVIGQKLQTLDRERI